MSNKTVFVTVGTTKFDELCETIVTTAVLDTLSRLGYSRLVLQGGNSIKDAEYFTHPSVVVTTYKFKDNITEDMKNSDLVISHAGAGTILEALDLRKPLLVVINTTLMDNHQIEIAEQLHIEQHLYYCTCDTLVDTLQTVDFSALRPYPPADTSVFLNYLNNFMGIKDKR